MRKAQAKLLKNKQAFTLIELLVVIAIIAILASILFPVFARARENARRASCQSNMKQLALGFHQYLQDYDELYPIYNSSTAPVGWADKLQPYVKSTQILQCPSDTTEAPGGATPWNSLGYTDYAYNLSLGFDNTTSAARGLHSATVTFPSLLILLVDQGSDAAVNSRAYHWTAGAGSFNTAASPARPPGLATFLGANPQRHLDGMNYAFADGHVKWLKASNASRSAQAYNWWTTNANTPASVGSPTFNPTP